MSMLVSLLLPTRGRADRLRETIASLEATASRPERIELLLKVDNDDEQTLKFLTTPAPNGIVISRGIMIGPRGNGYADLHHMYNKLCHRSQGRFLFLWNDDAIMLTKGWDDQLAAHDDGKMCYVTSQVADTRGRDTFLFPIVHRSFYDLTGHFSMSAHNDTYLYNVFSRFPQTFRHTDITVQHHALQVDDRTSQEARTWWPTTKELWDKPEVQDALNADIEKVNRYLKQQSVQK